MNDNEKLKDIINQDLNVRASDAMHDRMRQVVLDAHGHSQDTASAKSLIWTRSIIMKHPMTKLATVAAVVAAVLIGINPFSNSGSGVVWAEVARQVETCPGVIFRNIANRSDTKYSMNYLSATQNRKDVYEGGELIVSHYLDFETMTASSVCHAQKFYWRDAPLNEHNAQEHDKLADPKWIVQSMLSCEHQKLGEKTIEGVRCEGLGTTDPVVLGEDRPIPAGDIDIRMELWVSVATKYPVLCEGNASVTVEGQTHTSEWVMDQFQWNVELTPSVFEPDIPDDYEER